MVLYGLVIYLPWEPAQRYFLGHPVAIAATFLFCIAAMTLLTKWLAVQKQHRFCASISDEFLCPGADGSSAAGTDVAQLCRKWQGSLADLPGYARHSRLVERLDELLDRQIRRGNARHLADDLREVSGRDADDAHDSLQLVRIIVWAIPMLGFLGTVIGITQTLGGLDFSDGTAAVDRLKSGLYVAFDTTALGLVLSVIAIFLQFPVEQSEQRLLGHIDRRCGELLAAHLPDSHSDTATQAIAALCDGVLAAVQTSLSTQAELWRNTIDGAHQHWQSIVATTGSELTAAISTAVERSLAPALTNHATELTRAQTRGVETLEQHWLQWKDAADENAKRMLSQQQTMLQQTELLTHCNAQTTELEILQQSLHQNLQALQAVNVNVDHSLRAAAGAEGMADAIRTLARAMDVLRHQLPHPVRSRDPIPSDSLHSRRVA